MFVDPDDSSSSACYHRRYIQPYSENDRRQRGQRSYLLYKANLDGEVLAKRKAAGKGIADAESGKPQELP